MCMLAHPCSVPLHKCEFPLGCMFTPLSFFLLSSFFFLLSSFFFLLPVSNHACNLACVQVFPSAARRVTNFDIDLADGLALGALLLSHWPELGPLASQLKLSPSSKAAAQYNAGFVVKMMEELQLPWLLQVCLHHVSKCWLMYPIACNNH